MKPLEGSKIRVGAQPIIWSNDDFHDLGGETPLETCLTEMRETGYVGTELGHKFPKDPQKLKPILARYGLQLVSGWHSTYLATRDFKTDAADFQAHLKFLKEMGCAVVIAAECSDRVYHDPKLSLDWDFENDVWSVEQWKTVFRGLDVYAGMAEDQGMHLVYHHHMGTKIQNLEQIDRLMAETRKVRLLGDTGHLAFAGENPLEVFRKYGSRLGHVHLKNVRPLIVKQARAEKMTFEKAVKAGVFTVPGDSGIDYEPIFSFLKDISYQGWMVVEAEQDPQKANPQEYASRARTYIKEKAGL